MKIGDQKLLLTLISQMVRRVLQEYKGPGISGGTREAAAPDLGLTGSPTGLLGQRWINCSLPN